MSFLYLLARIIAYPLFKILYFLKMKCPKDEVNGRGCIVCSNHVSAADPFLLGLCMKRQLWFLAKSELWKNKFLAVILNMIAVPISRGGADLQAIRTSVDKINEGRALCIFPQGTRVHKKPDPEILQKSGIGMLASRAKCDIIPAYIKTKDYKLKIFRRVTVVFGEPIRYEELGFEKNNIAEMNGAAKLIWERICALDPDSKKESDK